MSDQPENVQPEPAVGEHLSLLEDASRNLSLDVRSLNDTLTVVNKLQVEQRHQRTRQDEMAAQAQAAKEEAAARDARMRRTFGGVALFLAVLLPLVSILVYASLIAHVNTLLVDQKKGFYATCQTRNQATRDNVARERQLGSLETNPAAATIHKDSAAALAKSVVDCSKYLIKS